MVVLPIRLVINDDIQIPRVLSIRCDRDSTLNVIILVQSNHIVQIKNGLFPMSVLRVRSGRERDGFVTCSESTIEPTEECVDVVVSSCRQFKVGNEFELFFRNR